MAERRRPGLIGRLRRRLDNPAAESTARWAAAALDDERRTGSRPGRAAANQVAAAAATASGPVRITLLAQLATILALEYDATAEPADLDRAAEAAEAAVEALRATTAADTLTRCEALTVAGHLHGRRFQLRGEAADIELAVGRYTEAIGLLAADDTGNHLTLATAIAGAHLLRYRHDGDPAVLARAAEVARAAAARATGELLTPPAALRLLQARILAARYRAGRDPAALAEASVLLDQVCADLPGYDREYAAAHALHAEVLILRNAEHPEPGLLGRAVDAARTATRAAAPGDGYAVNLALAVLARQRETGGAAGLDEAAGALRAFLAATGPEWIDWPIAVGNLIEVLRRAGGGNLDEAVTWGRRALAVLDAGHPVRPLVATNLTVALEHRHRDRGDAEDLREAHSLAGASAATGTGGHSGRATISFSRAYGRVAAYLRSGDRESLERARGILDDLVAAAPPGTPQRPVVLTGAALALTRLRAGGRADLADLAVRHAGEAVELTPAGHPALATRTQALGNALRLRHELGGDRPALDRAVALLRDARRMLAPDDPRRPLIGVDLGRALALQAAATVSPRLLGTALRLFRDGARAVTSPPRLRAEAAAEWGALAALDGDWAQAAEGYQAMLDLLPLTTPPDVGRLASDAAAVLLEHGDRTGSDCRAAAVAALEKGRAAPLADVPLTALRDALDADLPAEPDGITADQRRRLAAQWDAAVNSSRHPLRPPEPAELIATAAGGTVVVVNVSRFRCDALLLGDGGIRVVPLPGLDADTARAKAAATGELPGLLAWLGETVTGPVLAELPSYGRNGPGRLWWMPTGPLTALPLHAVAEVLDGYVSSYLPNLRTLLEPRPGSSSAGAAVIVAPDVAGAAVLPSADEEAAIVAARFPGAVLSGYPGDEEALRLVRSSAWLHLACPATPDGLLLGTVTLDAGEIARLRAAGGRLAFLSAGGPAGAFHAAGYRHVIAARWPAGDGAELVRDFYERLPAGGPGEAAEGAARALHDAVLAARRRHPDRPAMWAGLVHIGP